MSTNTNRNMEIKRVPVSRMLKSEVAEYARKVINITDKHYAEESAIIPLIEKLKDTEDQIEMLGIRYGIDPMREIIANYKSEMMLIVTELKLRAHIIGKRKNDENLRIINNNIDTYFKKLAKSKNDNEISNKINGFVNEIEVNEKLSNALEAHKLDSIVDSIRLAKTDFDYSWDKRVELLSERPKIKTKEIVDTVYTAIVNLFKTIEVAHLINPEEDHTDLALELSQLSEMYNRSISIRKQNNQRKNSKDKDDNATDEDPSSAPMTTAMHAGNDWENDWNDDDHEVFAAPFVVEDTEDVAVDETAPEVLHNSEDVDDDGGVVALE